MAESRTSMFQRLGPAFAVLLLLPLLAFPAGPDQSIYATGGRMLLDGLTYYTDIADVKPPFIHWVYAVGGSISGHGILGARILELLAHLLTVVLLLRFVRTVSEDTRLPGIAAILYALFVIALGPDGTGQPESFAGPFVVGICLLFARKRSILDMALAGLLAGCLFTIKFSMAFVAIPLVLGPLLLLRGSVRSRIVSGLAAAVGWMIPFILFVLWLSLSGALPGFELVNEFLAGRQSAALSSVPERVTALGLWFGAGFGITGTILLVLGVVRSVGKPAQGAEAGSDSVAVEEAGRRAALRFLALTVLALFASAAIELMMLPYQFSRIYAPAVVLIAIVLTAILTDRRRYTGSAYGAVVGVALLGIGLLFSPVPRYLQESATYVGWSFGDAAERNPWFRPESERQADIESVADTILAHAGEADRLAVYSGYAGYFYCYSGLTPAFSLMHGHQGIARFAPDAWSSEFGELLANNPPEFVVIELSDAESAGLVGARSTESAVEDDPVAAEALATRYEPMMTGGEESRRSFALYRLKDPDLR